MIVRQFRDSGIAEFRAFLAQCRTNPSTPVPVQLLEDNAHTEVLRPPMTVESQQFKTKEDAAIYLARELAPLPDHEVALNGGLWTWLSLFYFDEVCRVKQGKRAVTNDYSYVFEPKNSYHYYRHLLFISWRVLKVAPRHNRLFLGGPLSSLEQFTAEVMKRLFVVRIPCIFEVLDRIYWDDKRGGARPGMVSSEMIKPGDVIHRFPSRIRQLERTYDLHSLTADQMIALLGDEFRFERQPAKSRRQSASGRDTAA